MSRETLLPKLAAHVLAHGLSNASLRPLARAAGTSDRMLIYHFGNKTDLISDLLDYLAEQFELALKTAFPDERAESRRDCARRVIDITAQAAFAPFFALWWEIVAGAARGDKSYLSSSSRIMDRLLDWVVDHLPNDDPDPQAGAKAVLTMIEGAQMMGAVGRPEIGRAAVGSLDG